jgi:hypothetical protein
LDDLGDVVGGDLFFDQDIGRGVRVGGSLEFLLQGRQFAVLQTGRGLQVTVTLGPLDLSVQFVDALFEFAYAVQAGLLPLPAGIERVQLLGKVGQFAAQFRQPLGRGLVGLLGQRQLLHPQPIHRSLQLVDLDGT